MLHHLAVNAEEARFSPQAFRPPAKAEHSLVLRESAKIHGIGEAAIDIPLVVRRNRF